VRTSSRWLRRTRNVETSFVEQADFERSGLHAREWGKRGGARVVYIWRNEKFPVFLITVFPKNEKENLSVAERNALKKRADSIFETYRS
jgi:hypothetical protein